MSGISLRSPRFVFDLVISKLSMNRIASSSIETGLS